MALTALPTTPVTNLTEIAAATDTVWLRANAHLCEQRVGALLDADSPEAHRHGIAYHASAQQLVRLGFPDIRPA